MLACVELVSVKLTAPSLELPLLQRQSTPLRCYVDWPDACVEYRVLRIPLLLLVPEVFSGDAMRLVLLPVDVLFHIQLSLIDPIIVDGGPSLICGEDEVLAVQCIEGLQLFIGVYTLESNSRGLRLLVESGKLLVGQTAVVHRLGIWTVLSGKAPLQRQIVLECVLEQYVSVITPTRDVDSTATRTGAAIKQCFAYITGVLPADFNYFLIQALRIRQNSRGIASNGNSPAGDLTVLIQEVTLEYLEL